MTDWHWVDWYQRPGVVSPESNSSSCYAGYEGCPVAKNKEEILYKLMVGDTSNLSAGEKSWHFHTPNPGTDLGEELNPHFDSVEGLKLRKCLHKRSCRSRLCINNELWTI